MVLRVFCIISMLLALANSTFAQGHQGLLKIIETEIPQDQRQHQLDGFMSDSLPNLSLMERAECYHDLGGKWYYQNFLNSGNIAFLEKAINVTLKSLQLKRQFNLRELCAINRTLYNLGLFYSDYNKEYMALDYLLEVIRKGREYCPEGGAENLVELAYHEAGDLYMKVGDFFKALDIYNKLISDYTEENEGVIWAFLRLSEIYTAIDLKGNSDLVKLNLDKALAHLDKSDIPCCFYENRINQLEGNRLSEIKAHTESVFYHQKVIDHLPKNDSVNLAIAYNSLGNSYFQLGNKKLAQEILLKTISLNEDFDSPHNNLGDLHASDHHYEKALKSYQTAINLVISRNLRLHHKELPSHEYLEYSPNKIQLLNHIVTKANTWLKFFQYDNNKEHLIHALETFTLADQLVDIIRSESTEYQSKLFWREKGASLYMKAVEVSYLLDKPEVAYYFMERNKALLLLEDLTIEEAKEISNLPNKAAEREFNLKRAIFLSENNLQEAADANPESFAHLKDTIRENKYRYEQFVDSLNESYPDYAKFKKKATVLPFKNLKTNFVSGNRGVLHYILNEEQGYGLVTLADTTLLFEMNDIQKLNKDVESLIAALSDGISDIHKFQSVSNTVFRQLLPKNIYGNIKGKQLLIIPDYTLQRIPFEALIVDEAMPKYLIEDIEIGYAYSASLLEYTQRTERNPAKDFVGFAPIQFADMGLTELHFSENEIKGIASVFSGETMLNGQASKSNFIKNVNRHKIVHLATHADIGDGENPWIAFSDSKMYLKEIYATRNQADMVVLSACNTSNGSLKRGEGVMSLARGFFYSGSKSVVSSLWPIEDEAGKDILIDFYKNLGRGDSKSKALQNAKLAYLKTTSEEELKHPFFWAGFVVLGDNTPIVQAFNWSWIILSMGLAVSAILVYRFRSIKFFQ